MKSINLTTLKPGSYPYQFDLCDDFFRDIESFEILGGTVHVDATLNLRADDYDLLLAVEGEVAVTCDRCLEPMNIHVSEKESFSSPDEYNEHLDNHGILDLQWLTYETIIVNLPLVHSHQPGGCNPAMDALLHNHLCAETEPES